MREEIVKEARSWLGTKFRHQGRKKKTETDVGGADCIGLVIGVCHELKICSNSFENCEISSFDKNSYARIPQDSELEQELCKHLRQKDEIEIGDVLLMKFDKLPQHVGIVGNYDDAGNLSLIHAEMASKKVVEHLLDSVWRSRIIGVFSLI